MTLLYSPGIDLNTNSLGFQFAAYFRDTATSSTGTITVTEMSAIDGRYVHHCALTHDITNINTTFGSYSNFAFKLKTALDTYINTGDFSGYDWSVSFDESTGKYTFEDAADNEFKLLFIESGSANLLGFTASQSGADIYTSQYACSHLGFPSLDGRSMMSRPFESKGTTGLAIAHDGTFGKGISRGYVPRKYNWVQTWEPLVQSFDDDATSTQLWTWESFFRLTRQNRPFAVVTDSVMELHVNREEGAYFEPEAQDIDVHDHWHIPFKTYYVGSTTL